MSSIVRCQCGAQFRAKPELAGTHVDCPTCGSRIAVPRQTTSPIGGAASGVPQYVTCVCGQQFKAPPHLLGKRVPCPSCRQPIDIPDGHAAEDPLGPTRAAGLGQAGRLRNTSRLAARHRPRPKTHRGAPGVNRTAVVAASIGGGLLLLLVCGIVLFRFLPDSTQNREARESSEPQIHGLPEFQARQYMKEYFDIVHELEGELEALQAMGFSRAEIQRGASTLRRKWEPKFARLAAEYGVTAEQTHDMQIYAREHGWVGGGGGGVRRSGARVINDRSSAAVAESPSEARNGSGETDSAVNTESASDEEEPETAPVPPDMPAVTYPPEDPKVSIDRIRDSWRRYIEAVARRDGKTAVQHIDQVSIQWYEHTRLLALAAKRYELRSRSMLDKLAVLRLREIFTAAQLQEMTGEDIFVHDVKTGRTGGRATRYAVVDVTVDGDTAQLFVAPLNGRKHVELPFYREQGEWKFDVTALMRTAMSAVGLLTLMSGKNENDIVIEATEKDLGRKLRPDVWEPLDPTAKLQLPPIVRRPSPSTSGGGRTGDGDSDSPAQQFDAFEVVTSVPYTDEPCIVFAPSPHPFVAVDNAVWDLRTGDQVGTLPIQLDRSDVHALSPSGAYFAAGLRSNSQEVRTISVFHCQTGERIHELVHPGRALYNLQFISDQRLISAWHRHVVIWDLKTGKQRKMFEVSSNGTAEEWALSQDGKYLATGGVSKLLVYDVSKGQAIASMDPRPVTHRASVLDGLAFSSDTEELAGIISEERLIVWSKVGKVVFEFELPEEPHYWVGKYPGAHLAWLPDRSGWLVGGQYLVLREPSQVVWKLNKPRRLSRYTNQVLGNNHLAVMRGDRHGGEIITITIPWALIRSAATGQDASGGSSPGTPTLPLVTELEKR